MFMSMTFRMSGRLSRPRLRCRCVIPVYVINLRRSRHRRRTVTRSLRRTAVHDFTLVPAVDGSTLSVADVERATSSGDFIRPIPAMVGCSLSHLAVRREIGSRPERAAVVIEDDCRPSSVFVQAVTHIAQAVSGRTVVLLYAESIRGLELRREPIHELTHTNLYAPAQSDRVLSALAYVVTREAAMSLGSIVYPSCEPDRWGPFLAQGLIDQLLIAHPFVVDNALYSSTIGYVDGGLSRPLRNALDTVPGARHFLQRRREPYVASISSPAFVE
jgi:GR25 family glycosyltransferase involved in LPS biosynthesis